MMHLETQSVASHNWVTVTLNLTQSSRKRRITRIGTHVFSLGRMIFARRESLVRMFFKSAHAKNLVDKYTPGDQKPFNIIDRDTLLDTFFC